MANGWSVFPHPFRDEINPTTPGWSVRTFISLHVLIKSFASNPRGGALWLFKGSEATEDSPKLQIYLWGLCLFFLLRKVYDGGLSEIWIKCLKPPWEQSKQDIFRPELDNKLLCRALVGFSSPEIAMQLWLLVDEHKHWSTLQVST